MRMFYCFLGLLLYFGAPESGLTGFAYAEGDAGGLGAKIYTGTARNGAYQGKMVLTLSGAAGSLHGDMHWSDGLEGDADLTGRLSGKLVEMSGKVLYRGAGYPISLRAEVKSGRIIGHYDLDVGAAGGKQRGEFNLAQRPESAGTAPTPSKPGTAGGNAIEPLSNGLLLSMTRSQILEKFGDAEPNFDACTMQYTGFRVICGGARQAIWHFIITGSGVTLNSGIGVGSSRQDVARVFSNANGGTLGQYKLEFTYDGERVWKIAIDPANDEFQPLSSSHGTDRKTEAQADSGKLAGLYWCVAPSWSKGTINLLPDSTYQMNGMAGGRYTVRQGQVHFDGLLKSWNNGVAKVEKGTLIFEWINAEGAKQYFAYRKN